MTRIEGVNVAAITPRDKQGDADFGAALEAIDFVCGHGVRGIALLGSTGEFASLGFDERQRLTYLAVKRSRVPMLVGVSHTSLDGAVALGREACSAGAAGLLLMPPYFFRYDQDDIREFYLQFAGQVGPGVPIYLYNVPFFTSELEPATAVALLSTGLFAGIKDSSGTMEYFETLQALRQTAAFTLLIGNDVVFARARTAGADGVVSGCASAVPELLVALDRAIVAGDPARTGVLSARLDEFIAWIHRFPTPVGVRAAAGFRGVKTGAMSVPLPPAKAKLLDEFREWFQGWLPEVQREAAHA
jgi:dihydrodipicolinate synthase/N-acetylneuraminate lyase